MDPVLVRSTVSFLRWISCSALHLQLSARPGDPCLYCPHPGFNYAAALRLNELGLTQGDAKTVLAVGPRAASGTSVERDNVLALKHLRFRVESGATYSLTLIDNFYKKGVCDVDQDIIKAAAFYRHRSD